MKYLAQKHPRKTTLFINIIAMILMLIAEYKNITGYGVIYWIFLFYLNIKIIIWNEEDRKVDLFVRVSAIICMLIVFLYKIYRIWAV